MLLNTMRVRSKSVQSGSNCTYLLLVIFGNDLPNTNQHIHLESISAARMLQAAVRKNIHLAAWRSSTDLCLGFELV